MNISMASIDFKTADISLREKLSFSDKKVRETLQTIYKKEHVKGVVLLCTCNRTEIYISTHQDICPATLLLEFAGVRDESLLTRITVKKGDYAIQHLMEVNCGLRSMVLFEDQIITQVKKAATMAREEKTMDAILETIFRLATTAAKKAKTNVKLKAVPKSMAEKAVRLLDELHVVKNKKCLIIGNGETGQLCAKQLIERGAKVTITTRTYHSGLNDAMIGSDFIAYDQRVNKFSEVDFIISATTSPHYTIMCDMLIDLKKHPTCVVDLALPRDVEPSVSEIKDIHYYNIDSFYDDNDEKAILKEIGLVKKIIQEQRQEFQRWYTFRKVN